MKQKIEVKKIDTIIGIDPGANGGVFVINNFANVAIKNPRTVTEWQRLIKKYSVGTTIIFIEKLNVAPMDANEPGKIFRIQKMINGFSELKTILELSGLPFVLVAPMKWQNALCLRQQGETKQQRKNRYKIMAQKLHPEIKATLWNADAILIAEFGRYAIDNLPKWLFSNVPESQKEKIFVFE